MKNGYVIASQEGLEQINTKLSQMDSTKLDELRGALKIGLQWDTEVTLGDSGHLVSHAYCSALPVAYSPHAPEKWEQFARIVLEAAYEATLAAAVINLANTGNNKVFLTRLIVPTATSGRKRKMTKDPPTTPVNQAPITHTDPPTAPLTFTNAGGTGHSG